MRVTCRLRSYSACHLHPFAASSLIKLDVNQSQNQREHHTDDYINEVRQLVVRRGQAFDLDLELSGVNFNKSTDRLQLLFAAGK